MHLFLFLFFSVIEGDRIARLLQSYFMLYSYFDRIDGRYSCDLYKFVFVYIVFIVFIMYSCCMYFISCPMLCNKGHCCDMLCVTETEVIVRTLSMYVRYVHYPGCVYLFLFVCVLDTCVHSAI